MLRRTNSVSLVQRLASLTVLPMLVALFVAFAPSMAWGQTETGQISGAVKDSTGAVIAGAEVTATSVGTQAKRSTTTDANGEYRITSLLPAVYEVSVAAPGFSTRKVQVQVTVGSKVGADFELVVGSDKGEIVEENAPEVFFNYPKSERTKQFLGQILRH